jgi:hypothetical protein
MNEIIEKWIKQINKLSDIALYEPQAAYAAFVSGYQHKFNYFIRTLNGMNQHLQPLDNVIDNKFIPAITEGHRCTPDERKLLSLPVRYGGLGIPILINSSLRSYENSLKITKQLTENIIRQEASYNFDNQMYINIKNEKRKEKKNYDEDILKDLRQRMTLDQLRANELSTMKGASSWLSSLPLKAENFSLNKREFYDAIRMRYRWDLKYLPSTCVCGKQFSIEHAMSCIKGGYIHQRHDEIRDLLTHISKEISKDVECEPHLQPLTGENLENCGNNISDEARLDFSVRGFWQRGQRAFFDVRVFNPFAPSYRTQKLQNVFKTQER